MKTQGIIAFEQAEKEWTKEIDEKRYQEMKAAGLPVDDPNILII